MMSNLPKEESHRVDRMKSLRQFLEARRIKTAETPDWTHASWSDEDASLNANYKVEPNDIDDLLHLCSQLTEAGGNFPLLERKPEVFPLIIDLDIHYNSNPTKRLTYEDLREFITDVHACYNKHLDLSKCKQIRFFVEQRTEPYKHTNKQEGEHYKDGLHIISPELRANKETHQAIRNALLDNPHLKSLVPEAKVDWDDKVLKGNNWFLFGLGKAGKPPYKLMDKSYIRFRDGECSRKALPSPAPGMISVLSFRAHLADPPLPVLSLPESKLNPAKKSSKPTKAGNPAPQHDWTALNEALGCASGTPWKLKEAKKGNLYLIGGGSACLCKTDAIHEKSFGNSLQVREKAQGSGKPYAMLRCHDYNCGADEVRPDNKLTLKLIALLSPLLEKQDEPEEEDITTNEEYLAMKEEFEENAFKLRVPVCFNVKIEDEWLFHSRADLMTQFENKLFKDAEGKQVSFIKTWLKDEDIRTFHQTGFYPVPSKCPSTHFNEFKGFAYERFMKHEPVACPEILDLIKWLCGNSEEARDYILKWLAQIIQEPDRKSGVCPVWGGGQGTGKDFFLDWFRIFILGDDITLMTAQPETDLFGSFSTRTKNRLFIKLEEGEGKTFHGNSDKFKNFITSPTTTYHPKGIDPTTINFPARFAITTNNFNAVKVEPEDRRFLFFKAHNHPYVQNSPWFGALAKRIGNTQCLADPTEPGIIRWFVDMLKGIDISKTDFINERPLTQQYHMMRRMNTPHHWMFLEWIVCDKGWQVYNAKSPHAFTPPDPFHQTKIKAQDLFNAYEHWVSLNNQGNAKMTLTKFGCLMEDAGIDKKRSSSGRTYILDLKKLKDHMAKNNLLSEKPQALEEYAFEPDE